MNVAKRAPVAPALGSGIRVTLPLRAMAPPLVIFCAALVVLWQYDPLHRALSLDPGIFAYISQLVAEGFAPHKYAFNEQASLAFLLGGAAIWLGNFFHQPQIIAYRFAAMVVMAGVTALTYIVGVRFSRSRAIGFLAALILIGYDGYAARAATTLEPKSLMLVFGLATLYFLSKKKWLWAGATASAAGLAWQIGWGYLVVTLLLALVQGRDLTGFSRLRAFGLALVAALVVFGIYASYFLSQHATIEMLQQTFLAPILMHTETRAGVGARLYKLVHTFQLGFGTHIVFGALGAAGFLIWLGVYLRVWEWRTLVRRVVYFFLHNRRTAGLLLVTCGFGVEVYLDFQNYPDWIPLLPFISIFAAWLLWTLCERGLRSFSPAPNVRLAAFVVLALLVFAASTFHAFARQNLAARGKTWQQQEQIAAQINQSVPPDAPIWVLGKAELLFFMQRHNINKYIYLMGNVDAAADAFEPGGFRQMFASTLKQQPVLYIFARAEPQKFASKKNFELVANSPDGFVMLRHCKLIGGGKYLVPPALADTLFPANGSGCLKVEN